MAGEPTESPDAFVSVLYDELRRLAHHYMRAERSGHTLQTTALVHEAYMRLAGADGISVHDRTHFFAMAATMMRRILVDHARARAADKRGGAVTRIALDDRLAAASGDVDLLTLDDALTRLAALDPQQARIVELRFFTGLTVEETGAALGISSATVKREWAIAKAWLHHELAQTS
jgi:RNA polymerase sigma factor (TIGR02999 family)